MVDTKLKPYMGFSGFMGKQEGACLIFAFTARKARKYAWFILRDWMLVDEWIDVRATLMRNKDFIYATGNQEKLKNNIPHVIDSPKTCNSCELWGNELDEESGLCEDCWELNQDRIQGE